MVFLKYILFFLLIISFQNSFAQDMGEGPFTLENKDGKYYLTFSKEVLERDFLWVTTPAIGFNNNNISNSKRYFGGRIIHNSQLKFKLSETGRIILVNDYPIYQVDESNIPMKMAVERISHPAVITSFLNLNESSDPKVRIDFTEFFLDDNYLWGFSESHKRSNEIIQYQPKKFEFLFSERFEDGIDFRYKRTYTVKDGFRTVEFNVSFLLLAKTPMVPRLSDDRVTGMSFTKQKFIDFEKSPYYTQIGAYAYKYHLKPSSRDEKEYLKGKIVKPEKPIVYYVDPTIPTYLQKYFKEGIADWDKTFVKAGFKQAIEVKEVMENNFNIYSARYNVALYFPSDSYGGSAEVIVDKRSGEIVLSKIYMPHSNPLHFMKQYMVQAGAYDPMGRSLHMSPEMVGGFTQKVVTHEMGHSLGIHHNYLSSSLVPVEKLRDKNWIEKNGISPSVMDYSRYNYVAQPGDGISFNIKSPNLGVYDYWAVEWLYRWYPEKNPQQIKLKLDSLYNIRLKHDKNIAYLNNDLFSFDHRLLMEDIGDDPILASSYGIKNLKLVVPQIFDWTKDIHGNHNIKNAKEVYAEVFTQMKNYFNHVFALVGGLKVNINSSNNVLIRDLVSRQQQIKAVEFIINNFLNTPIWLLDKNMMIVFASDNYERSTNPSESILKFQQNCLSQLLSYNKIYKIIQACEIDSTQFSLIDLLDILELQIFKDLKNTKALDIYNKNLQIQYLKSLELIMTLHTKSVYYLQISSVILEHTESLKKKIEEALKLDTVETDSIHLKNINSLLERIHTPVVSK